MAGLARGLRIAPSRDGSQASKLFFRSTKMQQRIETMIMMQDLKIKKSYLFGTIKPSYLSGIRTYNIFFCYSFHNPSKNILFSHGQQH